MDMSLVLDITALLAMVPMAAAVLRRSAGADGVFRLTLAVAVAGALATTVAQLGDSWNTSLALTLWVCIAASLVLFAVCTVVDGQAWRLASLLVPYLAVLGLIATIWRRAVGKPLGVGAPDAWVQFHILVSVATYALLTIAAVAGLAAFLQERALKTKKHTDFIRGLPSVADSERLSSNLLIASEVVLGLGLLSGMTVQLFETGVLLKFDHKTLLSILAFAVIGGLLLAKKLTGVRGRAAARFVLLAYLLLTLAYPGVKFVTEVLLS